MTKASVIGVNSQIASEAASVAGSQPGSTGVGFAISSDTVAQAVKAIEAGKGVVLGFHRAPRVQVGSLQSGGEGEDANRRTERSEPRRHGSR